MPPTDKPVTTTFSPDITDELIEQVNKGLLQVGSKNLTLSIRKIFGNDNKSVTFKRIALYEEEQQKIANNTN
ncbi:hypothetical protein IQ244_08315 [Nostoc sp. LEGE 06077]|uniref:hypothetical protein n=1 Tax=Nostoc sp. LEGE 06077 TaxID=915325 RepID=UPI00187F9EF4|nr:hypothetical protein [Nostoc sp. LEGE 06077]MBE9206518.1 hypothetical protein [Nostoc sp. LEGE 06077]